MAFNHPVQRTFKHVDIKVAANVQHGLKVISNTLWY